MEFLLGGNLPKQPFIKKSESTIDWSSVNLPRYNPFQFLLCRNLTGLAKWQYAKKAGMTTKRYADIEGGNATPTEEEVDKILSAQTTVIRSFFEQWYETEIDISNGFGICKPIDYYKYKVFRDINSPKMKIV